MDDICKDLLELDVLGLLSKPEASSRLRPEQNTDLYWKFADINDFISTKYRLPEESDDLWEASLFYRLRAIKQNKEYSAYLAPYDEFSILNSEQIIPNTLDEVYANDPFNLLVPSEDVPSSIFKLKHVEKREISRPEYIARRKRCNDFDLFKDEIASVESDLQCGKKSAVSFSPDKLTPGQCYILRGQVFMLVEDLSSSCSFKFQSCDRVRREGRTRCVFSNGTESTLLYRSLVKAMELDGYCIKDITQTDTTSPIIDNNDVDCGYVYVLRSLSRDPRVRTIKNLHKIGFCSGLIEDRIKNAQAEPTYLMGAVHVVLAAKCYNIKTKTLEGNLHAFFSDCNVEIEVSDNYGKIHHPREWFVAPLQIIEQAIKLSMDGKLAEYRYNAGLNIIEKINA